MRVGRYLMGAMYIAAGIAHFAITRQYERAMPAYLPAHRELVLISGAAEILGGIGLMIPITRVPAAYGIIALLVAVFPANVWMAQHPEQFPGMQPWALYARLPIQLLLIAWAWRYTRRNLDAPREA
ncbi:MAG: DoxX family protein [Bryocella sp.]